MDSGCQREGSSKNMNIGMEKVPGLSIDASSFVPGSLNHLTTDMNKFLDELENTICSLTKDPQLFSTTMPILAQKMVAHLESSHSFAPIVEEIVRKCILEMNFGYMEARIWNFLTTSPEPALRLFHQSLLARCKVEFDRIITSAPLSVPRAIRFAKFSGELLLNTKDLLKNEARIQLLDQISRLLILLLDNLSAAGQLDDARQLDDDRQLDDAVLCCVHVLKLTGAVLEKNLPNLDEFFGLIEFLTKADWVPRYTKTRIHSILDQRMNSNGHPADENFLTEDQEIDDSENIVVTPDSGTDDPRPPSIRQEDVTWFESRGRILIDLLKTQFIESTNGAKEKEPQAAAFFAERYCFYYLRFQCFNSFRVGTKNSFDLFFYKNNIKHYAEVKSSLGSKKTFFISPSELDCAFQTTKYDVFLITDVMNERKLFILNNLKQLLLNNAVSACFYQILDLQHFRAISTDPSHKSAFCDGYIFQTDAFKDVTLNVDTAFLFLGLFRNVKIVTPREQVLVNSGKISIIVKGDGQEDGTSYLVSFGQ